MFARQSARHVRRELQPAPILACVALIATLTACTDSTSAATAPTTGPNLPVTATLTVEKTAVQLEVATTQQQQNIGLMHRTELPTNRGMLFPVSPRRVANFWMKDTLIPLDIVYLRDGRVAQIDSNAQPCIAEPCATYSSSTKVDQVIELRAGQADALGLTPGRQLDVSYD